MEFFASTIIPATVDDLQRRLTISELPRWCASIEKVLSDAIASGEVFSVWGTFHTRREEIRGGVRFTFPSCPNVFQWTITTDLPPSLQHTVIHATINRSEHDQDFIDSLQQFVEDWKAGLEAHW